jgi:hypothetical protein
MPAIESPPFPFDAATSKDVAGALAQAIRKQDETVEKLRHAVAACTTSLRTQGMSPEAAVITMKAFVKHAAVAHPLSNPEGAWWVADAWMDDIIKWCIIEYYRDT